MSEFTAFRKRGRQDKTKLEVYEAMPEATPIRTEALARKLHTTQWQLGFYLKLLKHEGKAEYLGAKWDRRYRQSRGTWRRK
jgi:hypothetical protein